MASLGDNSSDKDFAVAQRRPPGLAPPEPDTSPPDDVDQTEPVDPPSVRRKPRRVRTAGRRWLAPASALAVSVGLVLATQGDREPSSNITLHSPTTTTIRASAMAAPPRADQTNRVARRRTATDAAGRPGSKSRARRPVRVRAVVVAFTPQAPEALPSPTEHVDRDGSDRTNEQGGRSGKDERDEPQPERTAEPAPEPALPLHHFYNPETKDHWYGINYREGAEKEGYEWRSEEGKIFSSAERGTRELRGEEGRIGYVLAQEAPNTAPLYYCVSGYGDLFTIHGQVADEAQAHAWDCRGIVGYVGV